MQPVPKHYEADVCLIVEGCYPYVPGGVSTWLNWLMQSQPELTFSVIAIVPTNEERERRYEFPPNMKGFHELCLHEFGQPPIFNSHDTELASALAKPLINLFGGGALDEFSKIDGLINAPTTPISLGQLMNSQLGWDILTQMYESTMPQASFFHYFWAWRSLFGGMLATMKFPIPNARVYHTISTGYAGLLAARARIETNRPTLITEHGIYTNERRIEILMAEWIADTANKGLSLDDERYDLRDMWTRAFDAYARTCYQACSKIITLYEDNQILQRSQGAPDSKLKVIANGIDFDRFKDLDRAREDDQPTIALIGRVVPIKDVKTYIAGANLAREKIPNLRVLVMGPTDEDPEYFDECTALVDELNMGDSIEFTGQVQITEYMPKIKLVLLTSLSEAQPLTLLEAGAAGIPCITTNVGSCREILEGRSDESPALGRGGTVTDLVAPVQIANAVCDLLLNETKRRQYGDTLHERVRTYYVTQLASDAYHNLYQSYCNAPDLDAEALAN